MVVWGGGGGERELLRIWFSAGSAFWRTSHQGRVQLYWVLDCEGSKSLQSQGERAHKYEESLA